MEQNLNNINGRVAAAKLAEWRMFLADRWHPRALDDHKEINDLLCLVCSNAP